MSDDAYPERDDADAPTAPDGTALTPEEWDAVRRLRGERADVPAEHAAPAEAAPAQPAAASGDVAAEAVEAHHDEPVSSAEPPPPPRWGGASTTRVTGRSSAALPAVSLLLVLAIGAAVLVALVTVHLSSKRSATADATDAIAAATGGVATVLSYNYRSLDNDFTKAESLLTPSFRKTYVTTTAKAVQPLAAKYKAVSSAQVTAAGVVATAGNHVEVLVFVDQTVTNSQLAKPRLDRSRIDVDLVHRGGKWLINNLSPV